MEFWPSYDWNARIYSSSGSQKDIALSMPFTLVGNHPACDIRLNKNYSFPVVYIVFSFADGIEAWPLGPIAFPQWGLLGEEAVLSIGGTSISFSQNRSKPKEKSSLMRTDSYRIIDLARRSKKRSIILGNRVSILGKEHPSTIRIHGIGIAACSYAIVSFDQCCWRIDLNPINQKNPIELAKRFPTNLEIQFGKAKGIYRVMNTGSFKKPSMFVPQANRGNASLAGPNDTVVHHQPNGIEKNKAPNQNIDIDGSNPWSLKEFASESREATISLPGDSLQQGQAPKQNTIEAKTHNNGKGQLESECNFASAPRERPDAGAPLPRDHELFSFTEKITDRLADKSRSRYLPRMVPKVVAFVGLVAAAGYVVLIVLRQMFSMISD